MLIASKTAIHALLLTAITLSANAGYSRQAHAAGPAPRINCVAPHHRDLDLTPIGSGPLELAEIYCQFFRFSTKGDPIVSPDGRSIAYVENRRLLRVAPLDARDSWIDFQAELGTFERFGSNSRSVPALTWASDSSGLWTATQGRLHPSGFATDPLQPIKTFSDGNIELLPMLQHPAGPLDGLLWADGNGSALAQLGTRGGYYRPEHDDPTPSFAMIDAKRGIVLDILAFDAIEILRNRARGASPNALVNNAAVTTLSNGKIRALLGVRQWVVWTQGEAPRILADPYADERHNRMVMSPDGSSVLVGRLLRTAGGMCGRTGGCTPGTPVEGILAALHSLETGQLIWSIRATVTNDFEFPTSAISDDGRYALVGLVLGNIALVSMSDGKVVQTFPAPGGNYAMGFTRRGQAIWTHAHGLTALYNIRASAQ